MRGSWFVKDFRCRTWDYALRWVAVSHRLTLRCTIVSTGFEDAVRAVLQISDSEWRPKDGCRVTLGGLDGFEMGFVRLAAWPYGRWAARHGRESEFVLALERSSTLHVWDRPFSGVLVDDEIEYRVVVEVNDQRCYELEVDLDLGSAGNPRLTARQGSTPQRRLASLVSQLAARFDSVAPDFP
jgi:hypothetical protein